MTLRGSLANMSVASLLSFLDLERKTGVLFVIGERAARLYLRDGRLLAVEIDDGADAPALDAAYAVPGWTSGHFEFAVQDVACDDAIKTNIASLLLEHARRSDEGGR
jgi:hypothetical protein